MFLSGYFNILQHATKSGAIDGGDQVCVYPDISTYFSMPPNPDSGDGGDQVCFIRIF